MKNCKIRQTGWYSTQSRACKSSIMNPASLYECCHGMTLTPIVSPLAQFDMIWGITGIHGFSTKGWMGQPQMRLSASIWSAKHVR